MSETKKIMVRVNPNAYSEDVYVLIPPKWWNVEGLAEGVAAAIRDACGRVGQAKVDGKKH